MNEAIIWTTIVLPQTLSIPLPSEAYLAGILTGYYVVAFVAALWVVFEPDEPVLSVMVAALLAIIWPLEFTSNLRKLNEREYEDDDADCGCCDQ